jgi:hypothetical protein
MISPKSLARKEKPCGERRINCKIVVNRRRHLSTIISQAPHGLEANRRQRDGGQHPPDEFPWGEQPPVSLSTIILSLFIYKGYNRRHPMSLFVYECR